MTENPYKPTHAGAIASEADGQPLWVYLYTIASCLISASLPIVFGVIVRRQYRVIYPELNTIWNVIFILLLAFLAGIIVALRTWRRLSRVHNLQMKIRKDQVSALATQGRITENTAERRSSEDNEPTNPGG